MRVWAFFLGLAAAAAQPAVSPVGMAWAYSPSGEKAPQDLPQAKRAEVKAPSIRMAEAMPFWLCRQERAAGLAVRALWIHHFRQNHLQESEKCLTLYSEGGRDRVIRSAPWLSSCQKALQDKKAELQRRLWKCEGQPRLKALFSAPAEPPTAPAASPKAAPPE